MAEQSWGNRLTYDFALFGGENHTEVLERHMKALESLKKAKPAEQTGLLVGHGRGLNTLLDGLGYKANLKQKQYKIISTKED